MNRWRKALLIIFASTLAGSLLATGPATAEPRPSDPSAQGENGRAHAVPEGDASNSTVGPTAAPIGYSVTGIDVSNHQGAIDWAAVAAGGAKFAYAKATEGTYFVDAWFDGNYRGAKNNGLYAGAYHYARPEQSSGRVQADYFLDRAQYVNDGRTLPPMLDIEWPWKKSDGQYVAPYPCYGLSPEQMVTWIGDFVTRVRERTGQPTMIYTNTYWWNPCTGSSTLFGDQPLFIANYTSAPSPLPAGWSRWTMWQYSNSGSLPGDQDVFNGTLEELAALAGGAGGPRPGRRSDFDGDGKPDIAGLANGQLWMHRNTSSPGNPSWAASGAQVSSGWGTVNNFMTADYDADGKEDILGLNNGNELLLWRCTSTNSRFSFAPYYSFGTGWNVFNQFFSRADFDGDGKPDIVGVANGQLWIHRNTSNPGYPFKANGQYVSSGWGTVTKFMTADFDGDGKADILGLNGSELLLWRSTSTNTRFSFAPYYSFGSGWNVFDSFLSVADVGGDGKPDLVGLAYGQLWIHRNTSSPGNPSWAASGAQVSSGWGTVTNFMSTDFDGDGKKDILGLNGGSELLLWLSTSTSTEFSFAPYYSFGTGWNAFNQFIAPTKVP